MLKTYQISEEILKIIANSDFKADDAGLNLSSDLSGTAYNKTRKVLSDLGIKWVKNKQAFYTESNIDIHKLIATVLSTKFVVRAPIDFFWTNEANAKRIIELAEIKPGQKVLEPCAGEGHLARYIPYLNYPTLFEIDQKRCDAMKRAGLLGVECKDFFSMPPVREYDCVIMHPPAEGNRCIDFIYRAWDWLRTGGNLVAIMSAGINYKNSLEVNDFKQFLSYYSVLPKSVMWHENPPDTYRHSELKWHSVTIKLRKK